MNQLTFSIYAAKAELSKLVMLTAASGCEVVLTRYGKPVAKLVSVGNPGIPQALPTFTDEDPE